MSITNQIPTENQFISEGLQPSVRIIGKPSKLSSLKERMEYYKVPAISIAFLKDSRISWTHTEGVIDQLNNRPIDANTIFQAASISKPVFASVLMKYRQDNNLDLDVDVNCLLKSWQLPVHQWSDKSNVTLRLLLSHSAGTTVHGFAGYAEGSDVPSIISLLKGVTPANSDPVIVDIEPGTQFRYSGGGTVLAQLVLQDQTKTLLPELATSILFEPLMMRHSVYSQLLEGSLKNNAAVAHNANGVPIVGGSHTYAALAAAGLWTTPSDLLRLVSKIQLAGLGKDESFFTKKTVAEILSPQIEPMGIGFFLGGKETVASFSHGGSNEGYKAHLFAHTQTGDGIAIMTNGDNGSALITEVLNRVSEIYHWDEFKPSEKTITTLDPKLFKSILGKYKITEPFESTFVIAQKGENFIVNNEAFIKDELFFPESNRKLFSMTGMTLELQKNKLGEVNQISFWGGIIATKVEE
jgi:CubicO group peptidase (beta-lactamase class C family)